jgi:hypothetical protein
MEAVLLIGSGALGDYAPDRSDLDVAVVAPQRMADGEKEAVAARVRHDALPCPARLLELVVYRADQARAPARGLEFELDLNTGPAADRLLTELGEEPAHWYLIDLAIGLEHGISLAGPPAREVLGEPPRADVLDALSESIRWHLDAEPGAPGAVLNACRAWRFAVEGDWVSKSAAAAWAATHVDDRELLRLALEARGVDGQPLPPDRVRAVATRAAAAVEAAQR